MTVEGACESPGVTRAEWLEPRLAVGAGLVSGGILIGGFASLAMSSPSRREDLDVLNLALAFEELQADFYARALRGLSLRGDWLQFAQVVGTHERAHVAFVRRALGSAAKPAPRFELTRGPADVGEFQRLAIALEDAGVALYNGQAGNLTKATLAAAAEIVSVEARHAAWARDLAGELPAPDASDVPADAAEVQARLARMGVRVA
jgi:Ferritin-like domain